MYVHSYSHSSDSSSFLCMNVFSDHLTSICNGGGSGGVGSGKINMESSSKVLMVTGCSGATLKTKWELLAQVFHSN